MKISINVSRPELSDHECIVSDSSGHFLFLNLMAAPGCAPEQPPPLVCRDTPLCEGCGYAAHGFVCRGSDGRCLWNEIKKIYESGEKQCS